MTGGSGRARRGGIYGGTPSTELMLDTVTSYCKEFPHYKEYPMNLHVTHLAAQMTDIPEPHGRLMAGTARLLNLELIANDPVIQASHFEKTVW